MRVNLPDYRFYRTLDGYFIEAMPTKRAVYWLLKVTNGYPADEYDPANFFTVDVGETVQINLPEEGSYIIKIRGVSETPTQRKSYYIRHYPTLRERLIPTVRSLVCTCPPSPSTPCTNGQYNTSQQLRNDLNMAINAIIAFKDIFMSPCFIKSTEFALRLLLGESIDRYASRLTYYLDYIDEYGYSPDTEMLMRELMSFMYVTAYYAEVSTIDFDYVAAGGVAGSSDYNDGELEAVQELFDFTSLEQCYYDKFNININEWMAKFSNAFEDQLYACESGTSPFLADESNVYEEIIDEDPVIEEGGGTQLESSFALTPSSMIFINGVGISSSDFTYVNNVVTFTYYLNKNDRVTIIR